MTLLSIQLGIDPDNRYVGYSTRESLKLGPKILLPQSPVEIFKPLKLRHLRLPRGGRSIRPGRASARSSSISSDEEYSEVGAHPGVGRGTRDQKFSPLGKKGQIESKSQLAQRK